LKLKQKTSDLILGWISTTCLIANGWSLLWERSILATKSLRSPTNPK
jgi:hypothetical protein